MGVQQTPKSFPDKSSNDSHLTQWGLVPKTSQGLHKSSPDPRSDSSSCFSGSKANGWLSPLHIAAQKGHDRIVRMLLQHNADCDEKDSDSLAPIIHAVIGGHEDVVRSLLSHGARIVNQTNGQQQSSALHWAVMHRREDLLRILLDHCLRECTVVDCYDEQGRTPLHLAVDADFEAGVLMLLQAGADPNYKILKA